jgi:hypothetical protein
MGRPHLHGLPPPRDTARAMSQENVEMRYRAADAFNRHDLDVLLALCEDRQAIA